jgi:hypothetical protein
MPAMQYQQKDKRKKLIRELYLKEELLVSCQNNFKLVFPTVESFDEHRDFIIFSLKTIVTITDPSNDYYKLRDQKRKKARETWAKWRKLFYVIDQPSTPLHNLEYDGNQV